VDIWDTDFLMVPKTAEALDTASIPSVCSFKKMSKGIQKQKL
jgi:hypothetical protein